MSEESKPSKSRISNKLKKEIESTLDKITRITRHIRNVEDNCFLLGTKLISAGEIELGKQLIANSFIHDASKFKGIEFEFMAPGTPCDEDNAKLRLKLAIYNHQKTNPHHVEYWANGVLDMPDVYLAELVCDFKARSEEFGTDLREYIDNKALPKWKISKEHESYAKVMRFVNLLCGEPFSEIK